MQVNHLHLTRRRKVAWHRLFRLFGFFVLLLPSVVGCKKSDTPQGDTPRRQVSSPGQDNRQTDASGEQTPAQVKLAVETWDALFMGKAKVGYSRTRTESIVKDDRRLLRTSNETEMTIKRFDQSTKQQMSFWSLETPEGQIIRFHSEVNTGAAKLITDGRLEGEKLKLEVTTQGQRRQSTLDWDRSWGGFFAVEQSLRREPMKPGEKRTVKSLQPILNQAADVKLEAADYETTTLLVGERKLLKINTKTQLGAAELVSVVWADSEGEVIKTFHPTVKQISYRTSENVAKLPASGDGFDLGLESVVKTKRLPGGHRTKRVVYRAKLPDGDPVKLFPASAGQSVQAIDAHTAKITVRRVSPGQPAKLDRPENPPTDADRQPNNLIQSDDKRIVEMASQIAPDETDSWKLARSLERAVQRKITKKDFSQAFATAAEVAKSLAGDCTEHAVLLTALCRARKIPARVAIGLVYYPQQSGFAYHMWTEVWIEDRWIPLDATLGQGGIGAAHLKLADSHLRSANAYSVFLPVVGVLGQLELDILEAE